MLQHFEVPNGLSGLKRDIILQICGIIGKQRGIIWKNKDTMIRTVIGISKEHFAWKDHSLFVHKRIECEYSHISFKSNPDFFKYIGGGFIFGGEGVFLDQHFLRTTFLDSEITDGIFRWTLKINRGAENTSECYLGAAPCGLISMYDVLGISEGSFSFDMEKYEDGMLRSYFCGVRSELIDCETPVPDISLVAVEVDTTAKTIVYSVNGKIVPHALSNIPAPLYLGITGYSPLSFTSVSFRRLSCANPLTGNCIFHRKHR